MQNCFFKIYPNSQILSFREKQQYSLTYLHNEEKECAGYRNPLISGFLSGLTNRYSCYHCKFAYLHRNSDLTLGDYWQKDVENQQPASLILVHSNKGKELVASENIHIEKLNGKISCLITRKLQFVTLNGIKDGSERTYHTYIIKSQLTYSMSYMHLCSKIWCFCHCVFSI